MDGSAQILSGFVVDAAPPGAVHVAAAYGTLSRGGVVYVSCDPCGFHEPAYDPRHAALLAEGHVAARHWLPRGSADWPSA